MGLVADLIKGVELAMSLRNVVAFALILLPIVARFFKRQATRNKPRQLSIQVGYLMLVLIASAIFQLAYAKGHIGPSIPINVFLSTGSRIQTSGSLVAERLVRSVANLTTSQETLINRLTSQEGRNLYAVHGSALEHCEWCGDSPLWLTLYNLPEIAVPYLVHIAAVLIATPGRLRNCRQWRTLSVLVSLVVLGTEVYQTIYYPLEKLEKAKTPMDVDWWFWITRTRRGGALLISEAVLVALLYASNTGLLFDIGEYSAEQRLALSVAKLAATEGRLTTVNNINSAVDNDRKMFDYYEEAKTRRIEARENVFANKEFREQFDDAVLYIDTDEIGHSEGVIDSLLK